MHDNYICGIPNDWLQQFEELRAYRQRYGTCEVPVRWPENQAFAQWAEIQRQEQSKLAKGLEAEITRKQSALLNGIGFTRMRIDSNWESRFRQLSRFRMRYGDANVPLNWFENRLLAIWVSDQRRELRRVVQGEPSTMTVDHFVRLCGVDFIFDITKLPIEQQNLERIRQEHGHRHDVIDGLLLSAQQDHGGELDIGRSVEDPEEKRLRQTKLSSDHLFFTARCFVGESPKVS